MVEQKQDQAESAQETVMSDRPVVHSTPIRHKPDRSVPEQIAGSQVRYHNWEYEGAREDWPTSLEERFIHTMYPFAKPSKLLVDYADTDEQKRICEAKAVKLKRRGFRYLVISRGTTLAEACQQLGEEHVLVDSQR